MTGPPNKRQKREEYQKAQQQAATAAHNGGGVDFGGGIQMELPKKKFYRQRAHANPFSDHNLAYPACPAQMDWSTHFPAYLLPTPTAQSGQRPQMSKEVEMADIGCGFGGLLVALSPLFPDTLMIGMELRTQVLSYIQNRILALRSQHQPANPSTAALNNTPARPYQNISALRTNTMKYLPNYFACHQLTHLFICFPDPHFKARKHKARIVSRQLCAEYAFVVRPGGKVYTITDVEELAGWIRGCFDGEGVQDGVETGGNGQDVEGLWEEVHGEELEKDPCVRVMQEETEEGKKVSRNGGRKFVGVWRRRDDPAWLDGEE